MKLQIQLTDHLADPRRTLQASGEGKEIRELPLTHYYSFMGYAHKQRLVRLVNELIISFAPVIFSLRLSAQCSTPAFPFP